MFPTILKENGETVTSQKKLADIIANHFKKKVTDITETFDKDDTKAMLILEKLTEKKGRNCPP